MPTSIKSTLIPLFFIALMSNCIWAQEAPILERNIKPLGVGDSLPEFQLTDTSHRTVFLSDYLKTAPLVLIYYRGGW